MKKSAVFFLIFALAIAIIFGFVGWSLSFHGSIGLLRVTPISLYVLILIMVAGIVLIGLVIWYWQLNRKGKGKRLFIFNLVTSVICLVLFPFIFVQLGLFPPSKNIKPITQLSVANSEGQHLHFAVGGDTQFGAGSNKPDQTAAMLGQIRNPANNYDVFFFLGDLVEYGFRDKLWNEALGAFSSTASRIPTRFVPGNHDTLFGGLSRYIEYCSPSSTDTQSDSRLWYRVDAGRVHFLMLDVEWSAETFTKDQAKWLETQLSSIPAGDWKIVMSHGFYYSSGAISLGWKWYDNPETISALTPLFEKYGVDIVFSGHNHYLEYLQHSGVNYIISGSFGGKPDPTPTYISPSSIWLKSGQTGFAEVNINGDQATLNFRDPDSNILKTFSIIKQDN